MCKLKSLLFTCFVCLSSVVRAAYPGGTAEVEVHGLVCDFCARSIEKVLADDPAVKSVKVNMDSRKVYVHFKPKQHMSDAELKTKITSSGYDVVAIRHVPARKDER